MAREGGEFGAFGVQHGESSNVPSRKRKRSAAKRRKSRKRGVVAGKTQETLRTVAPKPLADAALTKTILDLLQEAFHYNQVIRGEKQATMQLRTGNCEIVIMAADTKPFSFLRRVCRLAQKKEVPYAFVPSFSDLGEACGLKKMTACCLTANEGSPLKAKIQLLKYEIRGLL